MIFALNLAYSITTLSLVVLGLAIIFGYLGVLNMAHGEFVAVGAYTSYAVQAAGLPILLAIPISIGVAGAMGWIIEVLIIRHLYRRPFDTLLATWALSILLREIIKLTFGLDYKSVILPIPGTIDIFGSAYPIYRILMMGVIIFGFLLLFTWYRRSHTGARLRAMIANPSLAAAVGIDTSSLARWTFAAGAASAGIAGCFLAPVVRIDPFMGIDYLLTSFFALVVGGLGSLQGLIIGSGIIGGANTISSTVIGGTAGYITVLLIAVGFLWLRPEGIYARR